MRTRCLTIGAAVALWVGVLAVPAQAAVAPGSAAAPADAAVTAPAQFPPFPGPALRERARQAKERFDRKARQAPAEVTSWGVDEASGRMVVEVVGDPTPASERFVADADPGAVAVRTGAAPVRRLADLVGGGAIFAGGRCSIGFSVRDPAGAVFVLTAGHCTESGGTWSGTTNGRTSGTRVTIGPVSGTAFPGDDFGRITVTNRSAWTPTARVLDHPQPVRGSSVAGVGSQVCRSGSTTGYRCGTVQAFNQTVNYGGGDVVTGLTRTSACAEPGDSGGSFMAGAQAQGMTSGGSGDCRTGGTTFFQPVNEALSRYGVSLVTG